MEPLHSPLITIDGVTIDPGWSWVDPSILEEIRIEWGADSHYDEVPPAVLKLELIIPAGGLRKVHEFQDRQVEVHTDLGRLYRGHITSTEWTEIKVWDEQRQTNVRMWHVRLVANDPSARVRAFVPVAAPCRVADAPNSANKITLRAQNQFMIQGGRSPFFGSSKLYYNTSSGNRWATIEQLIDAGVVTNVDPVYGAGPNNGYRPHTDRADAFQLIREYLGTHALGEPAYQHRTDTIECTKPTAAAIALNLAYRSGVLQIELPAGSAARLVDADVLELPDGHVTASTDHTLNFSTIEYEALLIVDEQYTWIPEDGFQRWDNFPAMSTKKHTATVPGASLSGRTYTRKIHMATKEKTWDNGQVDTWDVNLQKTVAGFLAETGALIAKLNGKPAFPPVVFDWNRSAERVPQTLERALLSVSPTDHRASPYLVPNAQVLTELGIDTAGQLIGGVLTYRQGWRHELRLAPIPNSAASDIRLGQLVTNPVAKISDYDPTITLGTLGAVTQGAA